MIQKIKYKFVIFSGKIAKNRLEMIQKIIETVTIQGKKTQASEIN